MAQVWDPIIVTWIDAYSPSGVRARDFIKNKIEPCVRRSIGFSLRDDSDNVVICMEDDRDSAEILENGGDCETVTVIPRGMVVKIEELGVRRGTRHSPNEQEQHD